MGSMLRLIDGVLYEGRPADEFELSIQGDTRPARTARVTCAADLVRALELGPLRPRNSHAKRRVPVPRAASIGQAIYGPLRHWATIVPTRPNVFKNNNERP